MKADFIILSSLLEQLRPDFKEFFFHFEHGVHQHGIEMLSPLGSYLLDRLVVGPGLLVRPLGGQGVVDVGDGYDPGRSKGYLRLSVHQGSLYRRNVRDGAGKGSRPGSEKIAHPAPDLLCAV